IVAYVTQMGLGGHSIPINRGLLITMEVAGAISENEAKAGAVPGLERTVPKTKGVEVGSLLHQLGVEVGRNPYGPSARKLLLEIDPGAKDRVPKRKTKVEAPPPPAAPEPKAKAGAKAEKAEKAKPSTKVQPSAKGKKEAKPPVKKKTETKRPT